MADTLASPVTPATHRRANSALWYGLLISLLGIASQLFYFLRPPQAITLLLPWINLLLPAIGLTFLFIGLARTFSSSTRHNNYV